MSAAPSDPALAAARRQFEAASPAMDRTFRYRLRRCPARRRAEAIATARAVAWAAWHGLLRRGRDPRAVGVHGIAGNAARDVTRGRKFGCGTAGSGALDVYHPRARSRGGFRVISLDAGAAAPAAGPRKEGWRAWLAEDNRVSPADEACFRLDFREWLGRLPERKRAAALLLAEGGTTGEAARALGVTPGAVSQARAWLAKSWGAFQAQAAPCADANRTADGHGPRPPAPGKG
jgi:DNA-directed RNA polymerase specialized sigma24 family protein